MTQCISDLALDYHPRRPVQVSFDAPEVSSDAGLLLLRAQDDVTGLSEGFAAVLPDLRDVNRVKHSRLEQVRQRVYQIAVGYEDCNDADHMRHDKLLKTCCDRLPEDEGLSSQPTLSRFETGFSMRSIRALLEFFETSYVDSLPADTETVVLDIDGFADPVHGAQQLALFSGYYRQRMYFPLAIFDGEGELVTCLLRAGTVRDHRGARYVLERLIRRIKARFPDAVVLIRGDSHFATERLMSCLERLDEELGAVDFLFGLAKNARLNRLLNAAMETAQSRYEGAEPARVFADFKYKTRRTWSRERHIVGSASFTSEGPNPRFVVTSLAEFPAAPLYRAYSQRGNAENRIKDFKRAIQADRLSCSTFAANFFRLLLHVLAYRLLLAVRRTVGEVAPKLGRARMDTLRVRLLKVAAVVTQSARRIRVRLPKVFPLAATFRKVALLLTRRSDPG
jgi:hypothetical protein